MKKMLSLFAAMIVVGIVAEEPAAPAPVKMNLANFRIYKAAANGGIVEKVAKTAENPEVRRKFVPDPSKEMVLFPAVTVPPVISTCPPALCI